MGPLTVTRYVGQNLVRGFGPDERLWAFIVQHVQVFADRHLQFIDAAKDTATYALVGHFCKPTFHQVDPRALSGSEVQVKARSLGERFGSALFCECCSCPARCERPDLQAHWLRWC